MKFSLKQLYGYSIMNWEQSQRMHTKATYSRDCSFCLDTDTKCSECKIDPLICYDAEPSLYDVVWRIERKMEYAIDELIRALRTAYWECD